MPVPETQLQPNMVAAFVHLTTGQLEPTLETSLATNATPLLPPGQPGTGNHCSRSGCCRCSHSACLLVHSLHRSGCCRRCRRCRRCLSLQPCGTGNREPSAHQAAVVSGFQGTNTDHNQPGSDAAPLYAGTSHHTLTVLSQSQGVSIKGVHRPIPKFGQCRPGRQQPPASCSTALTTLMTHLKSCR